jgi:hypothetical protein
MVRRLMEVPARKLRRAKLLVAEAAASDAAEAMSESVAKIAALQR